MEDGCCFEVGSQYLPGTIKEYDEMLQSEYAVSGLSCEPGTSRSESVVLTTRPQLSVLRMVNLVSMLTVTVKSRET
jgi:hypothetical protein